MFYKWWAAQYDRDVLDEKSKMRGITTRKRKEAVRIKRRISLKGHNSSVVGKVAAGKSIMNNSRENWTCCSLE